MVWCCSQGGLLEMIYTSPWLHQFRRHYWAKLCQHLYIFIKAFFFFFWRYLVSFRWVKHLSPSTQYKNFSAFWQSLEFVKKKMILWKSLCENNSTEVFVSMRECVKENGYEFEIIKLKFWLTLLIVGAILSRLHTWIFLSVKWWEIHFKLQSVRGWNPRNLWWNLTCDRALKWSLKLCVWPYDLRYLADHTIYQTIKHTKILEG